MKPSILTLMLLATLQAAPVPDALINWKDFEPITDTLWKNRTLEEFGRARNAEDPSDLNWNTDHCGQLPVNPYFDFYLACARHDFLRRNYKQQGRLEGENEVLIDEQFKTDMKTLCEGNTAKEACEAMAECWYLWFRAYHSSDYHSDISKKLMAEHEEKDKDMKRLVAEAQKRGDLWKASEPEWEK